MVIHRRFCGSPEGVASEPPIGWLVGSKGAHIVRGIGQKRFLAKQNVTYIILDAKIRKGNANGKYFLQYESREQKKKIK